MCIVIDTNTLAPVFDSNCAVHRAYAPVKNWVMSGKGRVVYGGTRYMEELKKARRYLRVILQLRIARRAVEIECSKVDARETELTTKTAGTNCDDQHIIALLCVSGCKLVCSNDKRAFRYFKDRTNYRGARYAPSIYSNRGHKHLLSDENVVRLRNVRS